MAEIVSPDILANMGDLSGLLNTRGYTTATVPMSGTPGNERVERNPYGPETEYPGVAYNQETGGVVPQGQPGFVPQPVPPQQPVQQRPQPQISQQQYQAAIDYAHRMEQVAQQTAEEKLRSEDEMFLAGIDHLPILEQEREIAIRYAQQLERANQHLYETEQQRRAREEQEDQEDSKETVAWHLATQAGLPWANPGVRNALLNSPDRPTMDSIVAGLQAMIPRSQPQPMQYQQTPAQVAGQMVAAPARGGGGRTAPGPRRGSGDIEGLIKSRPYLMARE